MTSPITTAEKRYIWMECYNWMNQHMLQHGYQPHSDMPKLEFLRRYPDPKEPTIVTVANGYQWRIRDGKVEYRTPDVHRAWTVEGRLTPVDLFTLGEIAQEYLDQENQ